MADILFPDGSVNTGTDNTGFGTDTTTETTGDTSTIGNDGQDPADFSDTSDASNTSDPSATADDVQQVADDVTDDTMNTMDTTNVRGGLGAGHGSAHGSGHDSDAPSGDEHEDNLESVFAQSGSGGDAGWNVEVKWEGHNSGSHSEVQIIARETGGSAGENIHIHLTFNGKGNIVSTDQGVNNCTSWTRNGNEIDIYRSGHYNKGESFSFMIPDIRFTESQYEGGIGSYYPSGTNMHQAAPEFTATITCG